ncbi:MAG: L-lysine 2,3-aminomutase [Chlamydiia bacterium]|nr:L-lysine 2,3-aminomutase [Chlamydiia bacterium]
MSNPALWRAIQRNNFTSLEKLMAFCQIDADNRKKLITPKEFPLNLPYRLAEKIEKNSLDDPIFRQFVPLIDETFSPPEFVPDPLEDCSFQRTPSLLQKYHGRALLLTSGACALNCRYCFRQNYPYDTHGGDYSFLDELEVLQNDPSIAEVILSGGDPLSLPDHHLESLLIALDQIPHIHLIRFHSRFPIGIPERISPRLLSIFELISTQILFVVHVNHPKELDADVLEALKKVQKLGIPLLCQTVLLSGVNDSVETLEALCRSLLYNGIRPYYLFQLDRVKGSAHFEVEVEKGRALIAALQERLPGHGVPTYAVEIPGEKSKSRLMEQSHPLECLNS